MIRVFSAIVLGLIVLGAVWLMPGWGVRALVVVAVALGLLEYGRMFFEDKAERWAMFAAGIVTAAAMIWLPHGHELVLLILVLDLFVLSLFFMKRSTELSGSAARLACAIMGVVYLGIAFPFWSWIESMAYGKELVLIALVPACLCDTFALVAGKSFGRQKLAPRVSPNKTVEGLFGALIGSLVGTFLIWWLLLRWMPAHHVAILALIIWITSPIGDLVESYFKRSSGVKDSGVIIPGHGGVLDRLDALVFTGPAAFAYFKYVVGV